MSDIFEDLDFIIESLEEDKEVFLQSRNQLESESEKFKALRPTYIKFKKLYTGFSDNVDEIVVANSGLKEIGKTCGKGLMKREDFSIGSNQFKTRIQSAYTTIEDDIFPKLREFVSQISIDFALEENKKEFERERDAEIKKIEEENKDKGVIEQIKPYVQKLVPVLIRTAARIYGIPI